MSQTMNTTTAPKAATPRTILMERNTFYRWLAEVQGIDDPDTTPCYPPNFLIEETADSDSPYCQVAAYLDTAEGTVIARHLCGGRVKDRQLSRSDWVKVTIRERKPGPNLLRTVREMLDEEGEAA